MTNHLKSSMPEVVFCTKNEDGYVICSEKTWDDFDTKCTVKYLRDDCEKVKDADLVDAIKCAEKHIKMCTYDSIVYKAIKTLIAYAERAEKASEEIETLKDDLQFSQLADGVLTDRAEGLLNVLKLIEHEGQNPSSWLAAEAIKGFEAGGKG